MDERERKKAELREKSRLSRQRADELLAEELQALKDATASDLESLRPQITDEETYDRLIAAVEEASRRNESLAQLKTRLEALGSTAVNVGKKAAKLLIAV